MKKLVLAAMLGLMVTSGSAGAFSLPELLQGRRQAPQQETQAPVVMAQAGDSSVRIQQLEETIRQLNGRIEEMSFQLLQMQEQMRKTQEDNEFRFQELEKSENGAAGKPAVATSGPAQTTVPQPPADDVARIIETPPAAGGDARTAAPETVLGSIEFDQNGNPRAVTRNDVDNSSGLPGVDTGPGLPSQGQGQAQAPAQDPQQTASLGSESDVYQVAYNHILSGDYALAEQEFTQYLADYPEGARSADASFWLGEAQYSQGKFNESAKTFLNAHQTYGKSPKAPEMLLKLGMSLAALDNNETACATLNEVKKRYPNASRAVLTKVSSEQKRLSC
jgi:tol-pal system protein YbgF